MSTTAAPTTDTPTTCPDWCTGHLPTDDGPVIHSATVTVGAVSVDLEQTGTDPAAVELRDLISVDTGQEVRDLIAALTRAADTLEGIGPDELVCEACAPHTDEAFSAGVRAGRSLERGNGAA